MTDTLADDLTLPEIRLALAPLIAEEAVFDGWSETALIAAARNAGMDPDVARYAFSGGAMEMIEAWIAHVDHLMAEELSAETLAGMKIRERIRTLVWFRLEQVAGLEEALRRASAIMAMPQNALRSLQRSWKSADLMWRLAGDTATDYNHYTKRTLLAGIYAASLAVYVDDTSEEKSDSAAFLDRRIEGVMQFEKVKARFLKAPDERFSLARFLGRLRYPAS